MFSSNGDKRDTQQEHLNQVHLQFEIFILIPHPQGRASQPSAFTI